jgi:Secretion system C-terminal sorting domain
MKISQMEKSKTIARSTFFGILFILVLPQHSNAYEPFLNTTAWYVGVTSGLFPPTYSWYLQNGDSVVNSLTYTKIQNDTLGTIHLVREDTIQKKVYWIPQGASGEIILYDFSIPIGGSWTFYGLFGQIYSFTLTQIDTFPQSGNRPVYLFTDPTPGSFGYVQVYEGIGVFEGPFYLYGTPPDPAHFLVCSYSGSSQVFSGGGICPPQPQIGDYSIKLAPIKDNTLYEDSLGGISNGSGNFLFSGTNNLGEKRRAMVAFDIVGSIPAGAIIKEAFFTLKMNKLGSIVHTIDLHRLTSDWGEGLSNAPGSEENGAIAQVGDATWINKFFNTSLWNSWGGDFIGTASASKPIGWPGFYTWSSSQLNSDVQFFLDSSNQNYGWILIGNEGDTSTYKRFGSREYFPGSQGTLDVLYSIPCINSSIPAFTSSQDTLCKGEIATLSAIGDLNSASVWTLYSDSCGGAPISSNSTGIFQVTPDSNAHYFIRGEGGCTMAGSCATLNLIVNSINDSVRISASNSTLIAIELNAQYQWFNCDNQTIVPGENQQSFSPSNFGFYSVIIDKYGCIDTSECVLATPLGFSGEKRKNNLNIFPNPSFGILKISLSPGFDGPMNLKLLSLLGESLFEKREIKYEDKEHIQLELPKLPTGQYILVVERGNLKSYAKVLIMK